jgi:hypothetical protein
MIDIGQVPGAGGAMRATRSLNNLGNGQSKKPKPLLVNIDLILRKITTNGHNLRDAWYSEQSIP